MKTKPLLARNIIARRKGHGWSQTKLSQKADLDVNVIKNIERGASKGSKKSLELIANAFGCQAEDLYQKAPEVIWQSMTQRRLAEMLAEAFDKIEQLEAKVRDLEIRLKHHVSSENSRIDKLARNMSKNNKKS